MVLLVYGVRIEWVYGASGVYLFLVVLVVLVRVLWFVVLLRLVFI